MSLFKKKINEFSLINIIFFYLISVCFFTIFSYFYLDIYLTKFQHYIDVNNNIILKSLPFDFGDLIHNLYYKGQYVQKVEPFEVNFHLARLPFYPIFILILAKINLNFYFIFFLKNIISFSIIFFSSYIFLRDLNKSFFHFILLLFLYWYNPYNTHVLLSLSFSDTLVSVFFPLMILLINSKNFYLNILFGIFIFCLYLLKPSLWLFCVVFPILILVLNIVKFKKKFLNINLFAIFCLTVAIFSWGIFGLNKSNYFPIGASSNSTNSFYLSSMLNKKFNTHYPTLSVDLLLDTEFSENVKFENEKEVYNHFKKVNYEFIRDNYSYYLQGVYIKIKFIFFGIYEDGRNDYDKKIRFSNFTNKLLMVLALIYGSFSLINSIYNKKQLSYFDLIFLFMFFLYLSPYVVAWATSKHLVPLFLLSKIYLFMKIFNCSKF